MQNEVKTNRVFLGILGPALAYYLDYTFEKIQCEHFHIPSDFIEIDVHSFLEVASKLVTIFVFFMVLFSMNRSLNKSGGPFLALLVSMIFVIVGSFYLLHLSSSAPKIMEELISVFIALIFVGFAVRLDHSPLLSKETMKLRSAQYAKISGANLSYSTKAALIAFVCYALYVFTTIMAKDTSDLVKFNCIVRDKSSFAIIKQYGQKLICKQFDPKTHFFLDSILVINVAQNLTVSMTDKVKVTFKPPLKVEK